MGRCSKDKRDAYYRLAKEQNWRARSAFKLIQLDEQFDLFSYGEPEKCTRVVDLCAAPGSWSQVLSRVLIKGESFGRRKWVEKMSTFKSDMEGKTEPTLESETKDSKTSPDETSVDEQALSNLNLNPNPDTTEDAEPPSNPPPEPDLQPRRNVKIVAIDLQPMASLPGITQLKADITHPDTVPLLLRALDIDIDIDNDPSRAIPDKSLQVDLVISDGAPDVTGLHDLDIYIQASLLHSALSLAIKVLRPGGKFVAKIFRGRDCDVIYAQLKTCFDSVTVAKPRSSRASSIEAFVVCEGFKGVRVDPVVRRMQDQVEDDGHVKDSERKVDGDAENEERLPTRTVRDDGVTILEFPDDQSTKSARWIAPFLACGDLDAYDADATYKLPPDYVSLPPVQPPTAPPYKEALERRRIEGGMYGKRKK